MTSAIKPVVIVKWDSQIKQTAQDLLGKPDRIPAPKEEVNEKKCGCEHLFPDSYEEVLKMSPEERHKRLMELIGPPAPPKAYDFD